MKAQDIPLSRENYLSLAGLSEEDLEAEGEASLPPELEEESK
jgi:hypothetical protein